MKITTKDILDVARKYGLEPAVVATVMEVESSGSGFFTDWNGEQRIKIQFEPHIFIRYCREHKIKGVTGVKIGKYWFLYLDGKLVLKNGVENQKNEWAAFNVAASKISLVDAMLSTSWGLGQIIGFNFKSCGYSSVGEMVDAFKIGEKQQLDAMMSFISDKGLLGSLRHKLWGAFAYVYNGKDYKKLGYDTKLQTAYLRNKSKYPVK